MYSFLWFKIFLYFIYFWLCGIFVAVRASLWLRRGVRDLCGCPGFSLAAAWGAGSLRLSGLLSGCGVGCGIFAAVRASLWLRRGVRDLCGCPGFSLAAAWGAGSLWLFGLLSGCGVGASHHSDFSCYRAQAPELRLTSSGSQA
ncbi:unnamed protein product [Rangifer tarandus platyrhynchus]|uniref:Uncharacterized protein n=1 Tax=Rangifer tarandus platyrhynchus TaxID=3082113 RepID=A0AC59ZM67_RANTA